MKKPSNNLIISVDFDGTLTKGNRGDILELSPNLELIARLQKLRQIKKVLIKIVTARGARAGMNTAEKESKYKWQIAAWLTMHNVPYDELSFNKEYANIYIDDMAVLPDADLKGWESYYTRNAIIDTGSTVVKHCSTAAIEASWYDIAKKALSNTSIYIPKVIFSNQDVLITEKIKSTRDAKFKDLYGIAMRFADIKPFMAAPFDSYLSNIIIDPLASAKAIDAMSKLKALTPTPTFFHGDLSISNCIIHEYGKALIDPNPKVFGSYETDLGKAIISSFALGEDVPKGNLYAVAEGMRVAKYRHEYIDVVNRYADL